MKYKPSIFENNNLRDKAVHEGLALCYLMESGKINPDLDRAKIRSSASVLKDAFSSLSDAVGTGRESVLGFSTKTLSQISQLKTLLNQSYTNRVESACDELCQTVSQWKSALEGKISSANEESGEKEKVSRAKRNLLLKLDELNEIKNAYQFNEKRLEEVIRGHEKDIEELENILVDENNERKINRLYSEIKAKRVLLDTANNSHKNYIFCSNLLDLVHQLIKEKIIVAEFSEDELNKARAYLKIKDLKKVISQPERAVTILKKMQDDVNSMVPKISENEKRIYALDTSSAVASDEAISYKQALIEKRRAKAASNDIDELKNNIGDKVKVEDLT